MTLGGEEAPREGGFLHSVRRDGLHALMGGARHRAGVGGWGGGAKSTQGWGEGRLQARRFLGQEACSGLRSFEESGRLQPRSGWVETGRERGLDQVSGHSAFCRMLPST